MTPRTRIKAKIAFIRVIRVIRGGSLLRLLVALDLLLYLFLAFLFALAVAGDFHALLPGGDGFLFLAQSQQHVAEMIVNLDRFAVILVDRILHRLAEIAPR